MITSQGMVGVSCMDLIKRIKRILWSNIFVQTFQNQHDSNDNLFFPMLRF